MIGIDWWLESVLLLAAVACAIYGAIATARDVEELRLEVREQRDRLNRTPGAPPAPRLGRHRRPPVPWSSRVWSSLHPWLVPTWLRRVWPLLRRLVAR